MREPARKYSDLIVWSKGRAAALQIYRATQGFPKSEMFGLQSQIRRAAVSIPSNIAEGFGRRATAEFCRFLLIARGSLFELETQLILAHDLAYLDDDSFQTVSASVDEVERMLDALIRKVQSSRQGR